MTILKTSAERCLQSDSSLSAIRMRMKADSYAAHTAYAKTAASAMGVSQIGITSSLANVP